MRLTGDRAQLVHYQALVDTIDVPHPFSIPGLVAAVARQRGCEITLEPLSPDFGPEVSGLVQRVDTGYLVQIPLDAERWWALDPASHEVAHIVCNHIKEGALLSSRLKDDFREQSSLVRGAEQDWGPMFRCDVSVDAEQEAEFVASLLVDRIERLTGRSRSAPSGSAGDVVERFTRVLGSRRDRRR